MDDHKRKSSNKPPQNKQRRSNNKNNGMVSGINSAHYHKTSENRTKKTPINNKNYNEKQQTQQNKTKQMKTHSVFQKGCVRKVVVQKGQLAARFAGQLEARKLFAMLNINEAANWSSRWAFNWSVICFNLLIFAETQKFMELGWASNWSLVAKNKSQKLTHKHIGICIPTQRKPLVSVRKHTFTGCCTKNLQRRQNSKPSRRPGLWDSAHTRCLSSHKDVDMVNATVRWQTPGENAQQLKKIVNWEIPCENHGNNPTRHSCKTYLRNQNTYLLRVDDARIVIIRSPHTRYKTPLNPKIHPRNTPPIPLQNQNTEKVRKMMEQIFENAKKQKCVISTEIFARKPRQDAGLSPIWFPWAVLVVHVVWRVLPDKPQPQCAGEVSNPWCISCGTRLLTNSFWPWPKAAVPLDSC